jgi:hypothetical protein
MGQSADTLRIVAELIDRQRKLADSSEPLRHAKTLWVATQLDKRLSRKCAEQPTSEIPELRDVESSPVRLKSVKEALTR